MQETKLPSVLGDWVVNVETAAGVTGEEAYILFPESPRQSPTALVDP